MTLMTRLRGWLDHNAAIPAIVVLLAVGALVVTLIGSPLILDVYTYFCISIVMVLSVQMFMGNSGILSWTHIGFIGIGAYASGILSVAPMVKEMGVPNMYPFLVSLQLSPIVAIGLGGVVAALVAAVIGYPLMRLSDAVGVITLFATLIVIHVVMTQWDNVTNGPRTFFGLMQFTTLWIALGAAVLAVGIAHWFRESSLGLRLRATRDNRYAAMASGVDMVRVRYGAFVFSALIAGLAGGLWAHYITSFSPKAFYMSEMFLLVSMLVIGGAGSITGAVSGTALVTLARELLRQAEALINNAHALPFEVYGLTELVMAVLMVVVLIWRPGGVVGGHEPRLRLARRGKEKV